MKSFVAAAVLGLSALVALPAFAEGKHHGTFPMSAADFRTKVDARTKTAREHMEKRASELDAEGAKELRAKFEAGVAKVNAEVAKVTADGSVTKDEAKQVRQTARELRATHHGKHGKHGKHARKEKKATK